MTTRTCSLLACVWLLGCADAVQSRIELPLAVAGTELAQPLAMAEGVDVYVDRADLAFGPLYLCAGEQAGELCETARLEWLESVVVDVLDPEPRSAGTLRGVSGTVRSFMYDLGLHSTLTRSEPLVLEAARELGGASLVVEGRVQLDGEAVPFVAELAVAQSAETEQGVPVVRKSRSERFAHEVTGDEARLLVRFDARAWLDGVDFRAALDAACGADVTDCESLRIEAGTQAYRSLSNALAAGQRPSFEWE